MTPHRVVILWMGFNKNVFVNFFAKGDPAKSGDICLGNVRPLQKNDHGLLYSTSVFWYYSRYNTYF